MRLCLFLSHCILYGLNENAVTHRGIIYQHMRNCADQLAVLDDEAAGHADVKYETKEFCVFPRFLCVFAGKRQVFTYITRDP